MPSNKLNITLTAAQVTAIQGALDALKTNLPFGLNLTNAERVALPNLQDSRLSFAEKIMDNYAPTNPTLVSGFAGTLAEAQTDWTLYKQLRNIIVQLQSIMEIYGDTQQVAGSETYEFGLEFYATAQRASQNRVPGTDAIVNDLGSLFANQGPQPTPPPGP
jgi:hypothetical protein